MSHYLAFAIIPAEGDAEELLAETLAPFDEDKQVEEYTEDGETYWRNPLGLWDFYQVGARFSGWLSGQDPRKDPRNWERCIHCQGTGRREDSIAREYRLTNPDYGCNGCEYDFQITGQRGVAVKWPTQWVQVGGDIVDALDVTARLADIKMPYALFTHGSESYSIKEKWEEKHDSEGNYVSGEFVQLHDDDSMRSVIATVLSARMKAGIKDRVAVVDYHS